MSNKTPIPLSSVDDLIDPKFNDFSLDFFPEPDGCTAFKIYSDSMDPLIRSSSIVFAKKVNDLNSIEFGEIYGVVINDGGTLLKYVKRSSKSPESHFDLISHNVFYDPMTIPKEIIKSMWLVYGWVHRKI